MYNGEQQSTGRRIVDGFEPYDRLEYSYTERALTASKPTTRLPTEEGGKKPFKRMFYYSAVTGTIYHNRQTLVETEGVALHIVKNHVIFGGLNALYFASHNLSELRHRVVKRAKALLESSNNGNDPTIAAPAEIKVVKEPQLGTYNEPIFDAETSLVWPTITDCVTATGRSAVTIYDSVKAKARVKYRRFFAADFDRNEAYRIYNDGLERKRTCQPRHS